MTATTLIHATAVAFGGDALLLRGPSGAGKSDLAMRILAPCHGPGGKLLAPLLVADDQVRLVVRDDTLMASAPETIRGLLEVRGLGIVRMPFVETARVRLVIDLVPVAEVPRMPPVGDTIDLLGVAIPRLRLHAFEASAPLKCARALGDAVCAGPRSSDP